MQDLRDIYISQQVAAQIFQQLQYLMNCCDRAETLSTSEIAYITKEFGSLVNFIPNYTCIINNPTYTLERVSINKDVCGANRRLNSLTEIRYRPRQIAASTDYNRANLKGQIVFYAGNMGSLPVVIETQPKKGHLITQSKWQLKPGKSIEVVVLCESEDAVNSNPKELNDDFNHYINTLRQLTPNTRKIVETYYELVFKSFLKPVNPTNRQGYLISALIADLLLNGPLYNVDAIMYPSVPNNGSAMNFAVKPDIVDNAFTMIEANEGVVINDPSSNGAGWEIFGTGICKYYDTNSLQLSWNNLSIPDNEPAYDLISEFDITFD